MPIPEFGIIETKFEMVSRKIGINKSEIETTDSRSGSGGVWRAWRPFSGRSGTTQGHVHQNGTVVGIISKFRTFTKQSERVPHRCEGCICLHHATNQRIPR